MTASNDMSESDKKAVQFLASLSVSHPHFGPPAVSAIAAIRRLSSELAQVKKELGDEADWSGTMEAEAVRMEELIRTVIKTAEPATSGYLESQLHDILERHGDGTAKVGRVPALYQKHVDRLSAELAQAREKISKLKYELQDLQDLHEN